MNLDLTSSSSRTQNSTTQKKSYKPKKIKHKEHKKIKLRKIINHGLLNDRPSISLLNKNKLHGISNITIYFQVF